MKNPDSILSVGIDIGTTTTHITLSDLELLNVSPGNQVPHIGIGGRRIVYQSKVHFTPLTAGGAIDGTAVAAIVAAEYDEAKIQPADVTTGAVIITGESAKRRNAREVVEAISRFAGDFVVASAGPHLESVLAGRGSGAAQAAADSLQTICNVDIGGGTTNAAVFSGPRLLDTASLNLGGRCLQFGEDGTLIALSESGQIFLDAIAITDTEALADTSPSAIQLELGERIDLEVMQRIGKSLGETIVNFIADKPAPPAVQQLLGTEALRHDYHIDEYWFSGGIAELMAKQPEQPLLYGDIGAYLARGLLAALRERGLLFHIPVSPIRATVIGAGAHSLQLSGSTISIDADALPLRNLPIIRPFLQDNEQKDQRESGQFKESVQLTESAQLTHESSHLNQFVCKSISSALAHHDIEWQQQCVALRLEPFAETNFQTLSTWAAALAGAFVSLKGRPPLIIICSQDIAMALGQLIKQSAPTADLVVIDNIQSVTGDYIDIGKPLANHQALPVVIKDLVFAS